jgi:hypothetical protein
LTKEGTLHKFLSEKPLHRKEEQQCPIRYCINVLEFMATAIFVPGVLEERPFYVLSVTRSAAELAGVGK